VIPPRRSERADLLGQVALVTGASAAGSIMQRELGTSL
jgi:hypothetical protein